MSEKKKNNEDDELEDMLSDDTTSDADNDSDIVTEIEQISDDEFADEILIEISDADLEIEEPKIKTEEAEGDDIMLSKHKQNGKHALKYDTIFKGKKDEVVDESTDMGGISGYFNESFDLDHSFGMDDESYQKEKRLKERVYAILLENTDLNFMNNRRKPSRIDFNQYYFLLKTNLKDDSFTNIELFNELSVYFSDNLFNMFKLLDNKWRNIIIKELQDHIGKTEGTKEIKNRNIYIGTELEFIADDKLITGVVVNCDYDNSEFKIDSYENIYDIELSDVTQILNNEKFRYNLNRLNNIDFL